VLTLSAVDREFESNQRL